ncbi:PI-PLC X domain-containing protein 1-like [Hemiscyllium ocellatum]|uniref:PI-PLC X domain-containing protein 1-like n=1 Tax=Hemiscyllium ocellatum TaxID=170820 RepID=UPI00296631B3|nr:PI-PLC X domain-containing protein 1-like [Hemiscyllium ocellatum]XP_060682247.1 PI-PLC X domain-containing protein 1-like [Hemiscyllium ocellatum]XP_060682248.1 PI-PLC X domain-containing protein 1-like [Hemiscyllium ocellatum]XP_060682249.1 PI-PLC X domain-containing protein 1-like [Hemiscyllium ocellatum]XP_060682250.1 PI-PLC X domain-containing protein 1-like [Hemiscyllium ocellatum]
MAHTSITKKTTDSRRKEQISFSSLLQNQFAHWMSDLPEKLWDESLCNLAIPGSHDSMTYCLDLTSPIKPSDKILNYLDHIIPCIIRPEIYKWCRTQESSITEQLEAGIRFFDLRIAHKPNDTTDHLHFVHGIFTTVTVLEALKEFGLWLKAHPKEVVILACRSFDGMNEQQHHELIQEIKNLFESKIYPKTSSEPVTLRRLWELGCQVIISYDDNIAKQYPELWPGIPYWWADTYDPKLLVQYLENQKQAGRPDGFFVAGINLTEDWWYILTHLHSSLKRLTLPNYAYLSDWIKKQVAGPGKHCFNIIAGDFIRAGYLVPAVLSLNNIDVKIGRFY